MQNTLDNYVFFYNLTSDRCEIINDIHFLNKQVFSMFIIYYTKINTKLSYHSIKNKFKHLIINLFPRFYYFYQIKMIYLRIKILYKFDE